MQSSTFRSWYNEEICKTYDANPLLVIIKEHIFTRTQLGSINMSNTWLRYVYWMQKKSKVFHVKYMFIECTMFMICKCGKHHTTTFSSPTITICGQCLGCIHYRKVSKYMVDHAKLVLLWFRPNYDLMGCQYLHNWQPMDLLVCFPIFTHNAK